MITLKQFMKYIYHRIIGGFLQINGLDFGWYETFYTRVFYALPYIEPLIQLMRTRRAAIKKLSVPNIGPYLTPGAKVLDIGANVGSVSSLFLTLGLHVYAYEPDSRCIALLRRRFKWYGNKQIQIHHSAVSDRAGTVNLNYGHLTTESNSIVEGRPGADGAAGGEVVSAEDILDIINQFGYVALIKMDIEGAEYDVLKALLQPEHIDKFGVCIVEAHARKMPQLMPLHMELENTISKLGLSGKVYLTWH